MITIDASVLVAAGAADDPGHVEASTFLATVLVAGFPIHQPTLALVEVPAAIARRTGDAALAREAGQAILALPGLVLHPLDLEAAADPAALGARLLLRAADSVYAATALRHSTTFVTLDDELRTRSSALIDAVTPTEWLARRT